LALGVINLGLTGGCTTSADSDAPTVTAQDLSGDYPVGTPLRTTADLNLRAEPSLDAEVLDVIPAGSTVLSASAHSRANWYGVTWGAKTGWVSGQYLAKGAATNEEPFTRQQVRELVAGHMAPGAESAADDFLNPGLTTAELVNAVGWLATHDPPQWQVSAVNSNHHYDPAAHSGGLAFDCYDVNDADDESFVDLVNRNPYVKEVGLSGGYVALSSRIRGKYYFTETAPTHVHIAVKQAYGSYQ